MYIYIYKTIKVKYKLVIFVQHIMYYITRVHFPMRNFIRLKQFETRAKIVTISLW